MKFEYFEIRNFKGIDYLKINLNKSPNFSVHTLVGLNESGKTTILEAINFFKYKTETLDSLDLKGYKISDIHDVIPISKRDNFNGYIDISGGVLLDNIDEETIAKEYLKKGIKITEKIGKLSFTQKYFFENSKNIPEKNKTWWDSNIVGKKIKGGGVAKKLPNEDAVKAFPFITKRIPNVLYFPNFLFEFPSKIYLEDTEIDSKHNFYKTVMQDILDSLNNNMNLKTHIIDRAKSKDKNDLKHLESVLDKMGNKVTAEVFSAWSKIFNKTISRKEIIISHDEDDKGIYLEFLLKDLDGKYLINERSLGFRWFFVFLLLTQFRGYRKNHQENALFLLDEPASNLHSSAQIQLLNSFEKLSNIIYTTHSHHLINPFWLENTFVVKNEGLDYLTDAESFNSSMTKITAIPYREFATKHPDQKNYFQPILDVLDYAPSKLEFINKSVFVEGKNDYYSLNYFQKNNPSFLTDKKNLNFIPGTSASNLESLISLYLGWGKSFLILLDSDSEGISQKQRYIDLFGQEVENLIFTYEDIDVDWKNFRIESLYDNEDQEKIHNHFYDDKNRFTKTNFHRGIQELLVKGETINIGKTTTNRFKKVLAFLTSKF